VTDDYIGSEGRVFMPIWLIAAFCAVAIHVGCFALVFADPRPEDDEEALGAPATEIGLELAAPRLEPTDLPPGPVADSSTASPAVMEQKAVIEPTDLPKATPIETEDPDRLVAPDASKKPKDDDPKIAAIQASPSNESVASEATAPATPSDAQESERSTAPTQGIGNSARQVRVSWEKGLSAHFDRHKRYPPVNSRRSAEIVVNFTIDRRGHILSASIAQSSGDPAFDEAALGMVHRSDPVPPPPPLVADEGLTFTLPVTFREKKRN
jgi:protein TonB